jgi:hypothetical protein
MSNEIVRVSRYILNLGFAPDKIELGGASLRMAWTVGAYLLLVAGIITRQNFCLGPVRICIDHLDWRVVAGSAVLGLAIFPVMMRWFNRKFRQPSWEHILFAFSIGFFLDLSSQGLKSFATKIGWLS